MSGLDVAPVALICNFGLVFSIFRFPNFVGDWLFQDRTWRPPAWTPHCGVPGRTRRRACPSIFVPKTLLFGSARELQNSGFRSWSVGEFQSSRGWRSFGVRVVFGRLSLCRWTIREIWLRCGRMISFLRPPGGAKRWSQPRSL